MSLKVFDLQCEQSHIFEGWFASAQAYDDQKDRGLLSCPVCGSHQVIRKLSAPRLNVSHLRQQVTASDTVSGGMQQQSSGSSAEGTQQQLGKIQAQVLRQLREMVRATENVGNRFAEEARMMHEGQAPERPIRGVASPQEREELAADGIAVLPIPDFLDDDRMQ
jgi:hypothetical protein